METTSAARRKQHVGVKKEEVKKEEVEGLAESMEEQLSLKASDEATSSKVKKEEGDEFVFVTPVGVKKEEAPEAIVADEFQPRHGTLERGHIYFLYRPKVEHYEPHSLDDVQRFHILLIPNADDEEDHLHPSKKEKKTEKFSRLIILGRKHLPDLESRHEVIWGFVDAIKESLEETASGLGEKVYETKTRGTRHVPPTRVAGRGHYVLYSPPPPTDPSETTDPRERRRMWTMNMSERYKTYLAYALSAPKVMGEVQEELRIESEGAYIIQVKDPDQPVTGARQVQLAPYKRPQYPPELKRLFRTKFIPANPATLLNYPGAELLLISSGKRDVGLLGKEVAEEVEGPVEVERGEGVEAVLKELGARRDEIEVKPLEGVWA